MACTFYKNIKEYNAPFIKVCQSQILDKQAPRIYLFANWFFFLRIAPPCEAKVGFPCYQTLGLFKTKKSCVWRETGAVHVPQLFGRYVDTTKMGLNEHDPLL